MSIFFKIKKTLLDNLFFKALSLFFAIALWAYVNTAVQTSITFNVPVVYSNIPEGLVISKGSMPDEIELIITGDTGEIVNVEKEIIVAYISLFTASEGTNKVIISNRDIKNLGDSGRIEKITPRSFSIDLQKNKIPK